MSFPTPYMPPVQTFTRLPPRIPRAPYRHATPSGPWPWQNLDDLIPEEDNNTEKKEKDFPDDHWKNYPESRFPNWKEDQVERSNIKTVLLSEGESTIYHIDVLQDGEFVRLDPTKVRNDDERAFNKAMEKLHDPGVRLRAFFVDDITIPVMQLIGHNFNVEPFFWTSSVNWIPSRYQENPKPDKGSDHITVVLKFPRAVKFDSRVLIGSENGSSAKLASGEIIDTSRPLPLRSKIDDTSDCHDDNEKPHNKIEHAIITDLLAIHMKRSIKGSTLITYHPSEEWKTTRAKDLHTRVFLAGKSVYWNHIFQKSQDPTFVMLATLWYALYAWDEALEILWSHISELELQVITTNSMDLTQELHKIRAHLLHYASLLEDFELSIKFILDTENPMMDKLDPQQAQESKNLLSKESKNLLTQVKRLKMSRDIYDKRLKNVMHLVFSKVNIEDSKQMKELTQAAVRDSAAMKQISYLTMVFLPASFIASIFGMNVEEINPGSRGNLPHYFETAIPLTIVTAWIIVAFQRRWSEQTYVPMWRRFMWPYYYIKDTYNRHWGKKDQQRESESDLTSVATTDKRFSGDSV